MCATETETQLFCMLFGFMLDAPQKPMLLRASPKLLRVPEVVVMIKRCFPFGWYQGVRVRTLLEAGGVYIIRSSASAGRLGLGNIVLIM